MRFQASLVGIDLEKETQKEMVAKQEQKFIFKDPKEYEGLSKEERDKLTEEMMSHYKGWAKSPMPTRKDAVRKKSPLG